MKLSPKNNKPECSESHTRPMHCITLSTVLTVLHQLYIFIYIYPSSVHHPRCLRVLHTETQNVHSVLANEYAWMHGCTRKLGMKICGKFFLGYTQNVFDILEKKCNFGRTTFFWGIWRMCDMSLSLGMWYVFLNIFL